MPHPDVTLAQEAIHNPGEPRHFMRLKPVGRRVRIRLGDEVLAETARALRVLEVGKDLYDPVLYVPDEDVVARLGPNDLTTHCPLKGDAAHFDLIGEDGTVRQPKIAWSYRETLDHASGLAGRTAFYTDRLTVEEAPL